MRADRLLEMMMLLQSQGKSTAQSLADRLGVSRRTILRDVEALSLAGVPIYAEGGHGGGIALDEQYQTRLTGLHTPEVQALFVSDNSAVLRDVGLNDAARHLLLKLLTAIPATHRPTVDHIRQRLLIDPTWWWHDVITPPYWDELQQAVYEDYRIEVLYERYQGDVVQRILEPYSLVNKSSHWYLVAHRENELRTYRVARFHKVQLLDQQFIRSPDFDLRQYWQGHLKEFINSFSGYQCVLCVHPERVAFVKWMMPGRWKQVGEPDPAGWETLRLMMDNPQLARMLVFGLGQHASVIEPQDLKDEVLKMAHEIIAHLDDNL